MLQFLLKFTCADVCTPDNLSVLTGLNVHTLPNQTCWRHWLTCTLTERVLLCIAIRIECWGTEHSVHIHKTASSLEIRHHSWSLKHTKESFIEFSKSYLCESSWIWLASGYGPGRLGRPGRLKFEPWGVPLPLLSKGVFGLDILRLRNN